VIAGPDIWALYLAGDEKVSVRIEGLLAEERLRVPEPVAAEALRRAAGMEQTAVLRELLADLPPVREERAPWLRAGELAWRLRQEGKAEASVLDAYAALLAHAEGAAVWTREPGLLQAARFLGVEVREG
jgi:hypothetical protein